jgi:LysM repeat protein
MNEVYVVKRGDTLWGISNQYGVSVTELASLNGVNADTLQVGQSLIIPAKSGSNPDNMFLYTVKKGDTLYSIARVYGVNVNSIKNLNYLTSNNLYIGQVLRIPEIYTKPDDMYVPDYVNYKVKRGDTLYSIAKAYGVTVDSLIQDNALKNNSLTIGQNLKIRTNNTMVVEECFGEEYVPSNSSYSEYVVKRGDNLYNIANTFGTSVSEITKINNLKNNNLAIGQVLKIPVSSTLYTVLKGDSLYSIARKFNTTVDSIKKKNNLISNNLMIGQVLKI